MTLADILTLTKAGYTAQQITAMNQQNFQQAQPVQHAQTQPVQQVMQSQPIQYIPVQQAQPVQYIPVQQAAQPVQYVQQAQPVQYTQTQPVQYVQPNSMMAPQVQQNQAPVQAGTGYVPTLPPTAQADPMKDVMLQNYMNVPGTNMYNVHDVVADMIGATAPAGLTQTGGAK